MKTLEFVIGQDRNDHGVLVDGELVAGVKSFHVTADAHDEAEIHLVLRASLHLVRQYEIPFEDKYPDVDGDDGAAVLGGA